MNRMPGLAFLCATLAHAAPQDQDWSCYLGDPASSQYSGLAQINRNNVRQLQMAWHHRGDDDAPRGGSQIQCNPLVIDGVLYGTSPTMRLRALDAATGELRWEFDPFAEGGKPVGMGFNRGLVYWRDGNERRILFGANQYLYAIDIATGQPVRSFGADGRIDLKQDLGRDASRLALSLNTPGVLYRNLLILGMRVGEGPGPTAPGPIRAYDVRTGKPVWRFNTIPHPGEFGYDTWPPDAYQHIGGANVWTGFALDEKRGIVFCPTGSAAFDFWGGDRIGQNLFANCLIALDALTGKRLWHFQFVHHDLWDRDLPSPPTLLTVRREGNDIPAVAQTTKSGHVFVFHRETGEPLFPIREVPVPPSDLLGESAWPTQPLPEKPAPFARQLLTYNELTELTPEAHRAALDRFSKVRPHAPFQPPSLEGTIIFPGFDGGAEWGGAAADPDGVLYVNANEMPWILTLVNAADGSGAVGSTPQSLFRMLCAPCHGLDWQGNPAQNVPALTNVTGRYTREQMMQHIQTGKGAMPSFAFLTDEQKGSLAELILGIEPGPERSGHHEPTPVAGLANIPYTHTGYIRWQDTNGYAVVKPPWGTLNAIDLNTGEYRWRVPLGEYPELTARGIPKTGTENYGGPVVTAGGLVFIAATRDECIRAFDQDTGEELWKAKLPAGGYATPATYMAKGKQYLVIAAGGGKMATRSSDSYVAFALPD